MRLELQFKMAAEMRFREHVDKHAMKRAGVLRESALIFSYAALYNLMDLADSFCRWLREHDYRYRYLRDIPVEVLNEFLEKKSATVSYRTLKNYESRIRTWEKIINAAFKTEIRWSDRLQVPYKLKPKETEILRIQQMQRNDFEKIMGYMARKQSRSKAPFALELSARFGLRVEGTARICPRNVHLDVKGLFGFGTIDITEKGGRTRTIGIKNEADREFIGELIQEKEPDELLVPIQKDSVNKFLNRTMQKVGIKERYPETSIHSIRKLYAQETWNNYRQMGHTWDEALRYVNRQLGHGEERNRTLLAVYVKNMW